LNAALSRFPVFALAALMVLVTSGRAGVTLCLADDHVVLQAVGQHCDDHAGADAPSVAPPHGDCTDLALAPITLDRAETRAETVPPAGFFDYETVVAPATFAVVPPAPDGPSRAPPHLAVLGTYLLLI